MSVAYGLDNSFLLPTLVSVSTLLRHSSKANLQIFLVFSEPISNDSAQVIDRFRKMHGNKIRLTAHFINIHGFKEFKFPPGSLPQATLTRLFVVDLVPPDISLILFVDGDTIFTTDFTPLFEIDLGDSILAAVQDEKLHHVKLMGSTPPLVINRQGYFNAGLLLINVRRWHETGIKDRAIDFLMKYPGQLEFLDQDALNAVIRDDWQPLESKWNLSWEETRRRAENVGMGQDQIAMIHFMGSQKPWQVGLRSKRGKFYRRELLRSNVLTPGQLMRWKFEFLYVNIVRILRIFVSR
jgi:lipopolysaccharide biosynthesis glycosyltransferase